MMIGARRRFVRVRGGGVGRVAAVLAFTCLCWLPAAISYAHEVRPAYLELQEEQGVQVSVLLKTPMLGDARLALYPVLSSQTVSVTPMATRATGDAAIQTWRLRIAAPLRGQQVRIDGLAGTMTDALVRVEFSDGSSWVQRLTPGQPAATIPMRPSALGVAGLYLRLGIEHILTGIDHLLFVLALLIITGPTWQLVKTITAFTVAHSITLAAATFGFVHVPSRPVEAAIALSIVFVAAEIVHLRHGRVGLAARMPWIVAFTFGLLHGFGFAGALSEVGLPQGHIPVALLFFNIGVEIGQLLFVGAVLTVVAGLGRTRIRYPRWAELIPPYTIGIVAMFWVIQRVTLF
jgi:hypothetical protein